MLPQHWRLVLLAFKSARHTCFVPKRLPVPCTARLWKATQPELRHSQISSPDALPAGSLIASWGSWAPSVRLRPRSPWRHPQSHRSATRLKAGEMMVSRHFGLGRIRRGAERCRPRSLRDRSRVRRLEA